MLRIRTAFLLLALLPAVSFAQLIEELPKDENSYLNFNKVIQIDNATKGELYLRSKQFFVDVFNSAYDVIQMDNKEAAVVIGKIFNDIYIKVIGVTTTMQMWYINIQSKEGQIQA